MRTIRLPALTLAWLLAAAPAMAAVGFQVVAAPDPTGPPLEVGVWYPTDAPARATQLGLRTQTVAVGGPPAGHNRPLVVISHGNGGTFAGHHDTAAALATAGFVVAALTHTGDNYRDQSRATDVPERARQLKLLTDYMVESWSGRAVIDSDRVGAFGFSSGGHTVLTSAGAVPDLSRLDAHCRANRDFFDCRLSRDYPPPIEAAPWVHDPRIQAVVSVAPAVAWSMSREALSGVTAPVQLWRAEADEILPHPHYAEAIRIALPRPPEVHVVPRAGHFVFLAPCSEDARKAMGALCEDPPGVDRTAVHEWFNAEVVRFFRAQLMRPEGLTGTVVPRRDDP